VLGAQPAREALPAVAPRWGLELLGRVRASASAADHGGFRLFHGDPISELTLPFLVLSLSCVIHPSGSCPHPRVLRCPWGCDLVLGDGWGGSRGSRWPFIKGIWTAIFLISQ